MQFYEEILGAISRWIMIWCSKSKEVLGAGFFTYEKLSGITTIEKCLRRSKHDGSLQDQLKWSQRVKNRISDTCNTLICINFVVHFFFSNSRQMFRTILLPPPLRISFLSTTAPTQIIGSVVKLVFHFWFVL